MQKIHISSLVHYFPNCKEHNDATDKISNYPFYSDLSIIKTFLESTDFSNGVIFNEDDLKHFIVEGNFMTGIEFEDEMLDDWKYLFDAFNVYFSNNNHTYKKDDELTAVWRKIMIHTFPDSTYTKDLKLYIEKERKQTLAQINKDYDEQIKSL